MDILFYPFKMFYNEVEMFLFVRSNKGVGSMPNVTRIAKGNQKDYYRVEVEGEPPLYIHRELVLLHNIKVGSSIQTEELKEIVHEDLKKRAFNRSLHFLTHRRRTQWEVEEYLRGKGFSQDVIQHTIEKLTYYKMLDDSAYMKAYIAEKVLGNPVGRKKIQYDLSRKGIGEELLMHLDDWYSREKEEEQAMVLAKKVSRKYAQLPFRERRTRIHQAGQRRGFSWEIMGRVVQD